MSYVAAYVHCVVGTKERRPLITPALEARLWPYLGGIATENNIKPLAIGGVADHVHILLSLPSTTAISKAVQLLKGGSSKWIHDTFPEHATFAWAEKYGAFSVSVSQLGTVTAYIRSQPEHHRTTNFTEEFLSLLKKHQIAFDEKYL